LELELELELVLVLAAFSPALLNPKPISDLVSVAVNPNVLVLPKLAKGLVLF